MWLDGGCRVLLQEGGIITSLCSSKPDNRYNLGENRQRAGFSRADRKRLPRKWRSSVCIRGRTRLCWAVLKVTLCSSSPCAQSVVPTELPSGSCSLDSLSNIFSQAPLPALQQENFPWKSLAWSLASLFPSKSKG